MFPIRVGVRQTGWINLDAPGVKKLAGKVLREVALYWHRRIMPGHFRAGAEQKYGYEPRKTRYQQMKQRRTGQNRPLVRSGLSEKLSRTAKFTGRLTVRVRLPLMRDYFTMRRRSNGWSGQSLMDELGNVTAKEANQLANMFGRGLALAMDQDTSRKKWTFI